MTATLGAISSVRSAPATATGEPDSARCDLAAESVSIWLRSELPSHTIRRRWRFIGERWLFQLEPILRDGPAHELQIGIDVLRSLRDGIVAELIHAGVAQRLRQDPNAAYQFEVPDGLCRLWSMRERMATAMIPKPDFHWHGDTALIELGTRRIVIRPDLRRAARQTAKPRQRPRWFVIEESQCLGSIEQPDGPHRDEEIWAGIAKWLAR
ncbi:MAG: hypothetical protein ABI647_21670 [Gemmatimonadota bacterium]